MNELEKVEIKKTLAHSTAVGIELENLVAKRSTIELKPDSVDRTRLILGYWSLVFDYQKSILALLDNELYGGAFALLRPMIEATLRSHIAISCRPGVVQTLTQDKYSVDFKTIGPQLDKTFQLEGFFERFLQRAEKMLHSFTHSGAAQLNRRFAGADLTPAYSLGEVQEAVAGATAMSFMITVLTTRHLGLDDEWTRANEIYKTKTRRLGPRSAPRKD